MKLVGRIASVALCCSLAGLAQVQGDDPVPPAEEASPPATEETPDESPPGDAENTSNEGLSDLDRAADLQLDAHQADKSPQEVLDILSQVVDLVVTAKAKGLDPQNRKFANQVQGSALMERATLMTEAIFAQRIPRRQWAAQRQRALADLQQAAELLEEPSPAFLLIARLQALPGGNRDEALKALGKALEIPNLAPDVRARALTIRGSLNPDETQRLADLSEAIELDPDNLDAVRTRGFLFLFSQKIEEAIPDLQRAAELDPNHSPTFEALATALLWQEDYDEALEALNKRCAMEPAAPGPFTQRARVLALRQDYDRALSDLDRSLELDPTSLETLLLRAQVRVLASQPDGALADVDELLRVRPGLLEAMRLRAEILASEEKFEEAIEVLRQLLEDHPDNIDLNIQFAQYLMHQSKTRDALKVLDQVLAKHPQNVAALRSRGDAHLSVAKHKAAIDDYERALEVDGDHSGVLNNLSWVLSTSPDDAVRDGTRALELAKRACELTEYKKGHILSTLASAYAELGDFEEAKKWSSKAVEIGSEGQIEQLREELASYEQGKPWRELQNVEEETEDEAASPESDDAAGDIPEGTLEF